MDNYRQNLREEMIYLEKTLSYIRKDLDTENENLTGRKRRLIASRKDMWENTVHFSDDFDRLTEVNQYLSEVNNQTATYMNTKNPGRKIPKDNWGSILRQIRF